MSGPQLAMDAQVTTALISGGVALAVALLGIGGAIAAQLVASRRTFANSLALFEQQNAAQTRERTAEFRREEARQFAEERKNAYARLLRTADDLQSVISAADDAAAARNSLRQEADSWARFHKAFDHEVRDEEGLRKWGRVSDAEYALGKACDLWEQMFEALGLIVGELELLASAEVREAARQLWAVDGLPRHYREGYHREPTPAQRALATMFHTQLADYQRLGLTYWQARTAFVDAARRELGMPADPDMHQLLSQHEADQPPDSVPVSRDPDNQGGLQP